MSYSIYEIKDFVKSFNPSLAGHILKQVKDRGASEDSLKSILGKKAFVDFKKEQEKQSKKFRSW